MQPSPPRTVVLDALATLLADESALAARTRTYQWNVVGPQFIYLQETFRTQRRTLDDLAELLGERLRALGGVVAGDLAELASATRLSPRPPQAPAPEMIAGLLADHEMLATHLRVSLLACGADRVSADLLARVLAEHEQMARVLRAFVSQSGG